MSEILIKNMEMPKDMSNPLHISIFSNGSVWITHEGKTEATAQELPPHGRLVDARELMKEAIGLSFSCQKWVSETSIVGAPTVIPASEGE